MSSQKTISLPVALAGMCICAVSSALAMNFYLESSKRKSTAKKGPKDSMIPSTALYARLLASPYHTPGLFKSLEAAVTVLRIVVEDSDRVTIMEKMQLNQLLSKLQCCNFSSLRAKAAAATSTGSAGESGSGLQVVVLEGLPGCGKSTLAKNLGAQLNAARVYDDDFAYPAELEKLHDIVYSSMTETLVLSMMQGLGEAEKTRFEAKHRHAVAILRAVELIKLYYMMYDIVGQQEANQAPSGTFVVVNYYHSLCAKALNSELFNMSDVAAGSGVATDPPADANTNEFCEYFNPQAFAWPFDLPKPSLVVYMAVQSQDRLARLGLRVGGVAPTEADAEALDIVKQEKADTKLQMAYSLVNNFPGNAPGGTPATPTTIAMNASNDADTVLQITMEICEDFGITPAPVPVAAGTATPAAFTSEIDEISNAFDLDIENTPNVSRKRGTKSKSKSKSSGKRLSLGMYSVF